MLKELCLEENQQTIKLHSTIHKEEEAGLSLAFVKLMNLKLKYLILKTFEAFTRIE